MVFFCTIISYSIKTMGDNLHREIAEERINSMMQLLKEHGYTLKVHENGSGAHLADRGNQKLMLFSGSYGEEMHRQFGWDRGFAARAAIVQRLEQKFEQFGAPWETEEECRAKEARSQAKIDRYFTLKAERDSVMNFASWVGIEQLRGVQDVHRVESTDEWGKRGVYHTFPVRTMEQQINNDAAYRRVYERLGRPGRVAVIERHPHSPYNRSEICGLSYLIVGFDASDTRLPEFGVGVSYAADPDTFCL